MSMCWASLAADSQARPAAGGTDMAERGRAFEAAGAGLGVRQDFSLAVIAEAQAVVAAPARPVRDGTSLLLLAVGGPKAPHHLNHALLVESAGPGHRVRPATADVTVFVAPGGDRRSVGFQVVEG